MSKNKKSFKEKCKSLSAEFKKFISRGNVVDMAVGVIIGGAFSTIVKTFTNILLSLATWGVPGGLTGLITVLPAITTSQRPGGQLNTFYSNEQWKALVESGGISAEMQKNYINHGSIYYYNQCAIIDWGAFINAIITFLIIALTLFVVVKVFKMLQAKRKKLADRIQEEYYEKHPEERPEVKPAVKPISELDVLKEMNENIKRSNTLVLRRAPRDIRYK